MADAQIVSSLWWRARAASVREYLAANPLNLGIPTDGALETIRHLLLRGDAHPKAQRKCWKHLALELEGLPGWDHERAMPDRTFFKASALSRMKEPPPIPPTPVALSSEMREDGTSSGVAGFAQNDDAEAASPVRATGSISATSPPPVPALDMGSVVDFSGAPQSRSACSSNALPQEEVPAASLSARVSKPSDAGVESAVTNSSILQDAIPVPSNNEAPVKPLSQMSMMERQEYWMHKKKLAIEAQRAEKEKENGNFSFKPNTGNSKRTYKASEYVRPGSSNPPTVTTAVAVVAGEKTGASETKASSKWGALRAKVKGGEASKRKGRAAAKTKSAPAAGEKAKKCATEKHPTKEPLATAMSITRAASAGLLATQLPEAGAIEQKEQFPIKVDDDDKVISEQPATKEIDTSAFPKRAFESGSFWWKVEGSRGHHRVRDGSDFQMWSIYRKKDKSKDVKGVSILVGRLEHPPYEEQVIQMMWDIEEWTEEASCSWWEANSYRYHGAACADSGKLMVAVSARPAGPQHPTSQPV